MALRTIEVGSSAISLGGIDKKTGKPNPESISGYYLGAKEETNEIGTYQVHTFQLKTGKTVRVFGKAAMNKRLAEVPGGEWTVVTFTGMVPGKYGKEYSYKIQSDDTETIPVQAVSADTEPEYEDETPEEEYQAPPVKATVRTAKEVLAARKK